MPPRWPLIAALVLVGLQGDPRVAGDLQPGMQLLYRSNGSAQPAWSIDRVEAGLTLKTGADCARIYIRRDPAQSAPDVTTICLEAGIVYSPDATGAWIAQRPVGPSMTLEQARANGDRVRYETGVTAMESIDGRRIEVIPTSVTTTDAAGQPRRRLRERYAVSLTTATGGVFEVPDPTSPTGWKTDQTFELVGIQSTVR